MAETIENGNVSYVVYKNEDNSVSEKYNILDAQAVNRLKNYVDRNLSKELKKEFTGEIEKNIADIKEFTGYDPKTTFIGSLKEKVQNLTNEIFNQASIVDYSRLDNVEKDLLNIQTLLKETADIEITLVSTSDGYTRIQAAEQNVKTIIAKFKEFGYEYDQNKNNLSLPTSGDYILVDENNKIITKKVAESIEKGNDKLVTSDLIFNYMGSALTEGDFANLGKFSGKTRTIEYNDLYSEERKTIANKSVYYGELFIDATDKISGFIGYTKFDNVAYPITIKENTILYFPVIYSGKIYIDCLNGNFELIRFSKANLNFEKENNLSYVEFTNEDTVIQDGLKYVKIKCNGNDNIKTIRYEYRDDFILKLRKDKIISEVPIECSNFVSKTVEVGDMVTDKIKAETIETESAKIPSIESKTITAESISTDNISTKTETVDTLTCLKKINSKEINSVLSNIENIESKSIKSDSANIKEIECTNLNVDNKIKTSKAEMDELTSDISTFNKLSSKKINSEDIISSSMKSTSIESDFANFGVITSDELTVDSLVSDNGSFKKVLAENTSSTNISSENIISENIVTKSITSNETISTNVNTNTLSSENAEIDTLKSNSAEIKDLNSENIECKNIKISEKIEMPKKQYQEIFDIVHPIGELYTQLAEEIEPNVLYNSDTISSYWINIKGSSKKFIVMDGSYSLPDESYDGSYDPIPIIPEEKTDFIIWKRIG